MINAPLLMLFNQPYEEKATVKNFIHKTLLLIVLAFLSLAFSGCSMVSLGRQLRGSGNVTTEQREVTAFTAITVSGVGEVVITQGDTDRLTVETDDNLQGVMIRQPGYARGRSTSAWR